MSKIWKKQNFFLEIYIEIIIITQISIFFSSNFEVNRKFLEKLIKK